MHNNYLRQLNSRVLVVSDTRMSGFGNFTLYREMGFQLAIYQRAFLHFLTLVSTTTCCET